MQSIPLDIFKDCRIVVIDDEGDSLEVAEIILLEYGASLFTALNGKEGLELIREVMPDFVISDISMPVMDGWGLINAMKKDEELTLIPVIALTAHAMKGDRERTLSAGFHSYLTKPLLVDTFIDDLVGVLSEIPAFSKRLNV